MGHNEHKLIPYTDDVILVYYKITQVSSSYYNKTKAINTTTFYMRRATTSEILQFNLVEKFTNLETQIVPMMEYV